MSQTLLSIRNLKVQFFTLRGTVKAVDGIGFEMRKGETLGIVGESGSGKTVTAFSIIRLVSPPGKIVDGRILFQGEDLVRKTERDMQKIRGKKIAMSFQDPMTYLNPVIRVGEQIAEAVQLHQTTSKEEANEQAIRLMDLVGIGSAKSRAHDYPHQLSGGMRQRILIAMAISCHPDLIIFDEPTTALDVITQGGILDLIKDMKRTLNMTAILITHDLAIVAELCDKVAVMYAGKFMEYGHIVKLFKNPLHPYTIGLMGSIPRPDRRSERLKAIGGWVPDMVNPPRGCRFHPRCQRATEICKSKEPPLVEVDRDHFVACFSNSN